MIRSNPPPSSPPLRVAQFLGAFGAIVASVPACGAGAGQQGPGAQSPERQSDAEYDVSLDYFFNKREPRQALEHARKAVELNDENAKALYFTSMIHLSFCSTNLGTDSPDCRVADAESYARRALKADDHFRDARNGLASVLIFQGKYPEAIALLEPLVRDPAYESIHLAWGNLGWAQVQSGQIDAGIASLKNSVTQPQFCVGFYHLGLAYEKKGDLELALTSLTNAVSVDNPACNQLQDAWEARAHVLTKLGRPLEARGDYEQCRKMSGETKTGKKCAQMLVAASGGGVRPSATSR